MNGLVLVVGWVIAFIGMAIDKPTTVLFGIAVLLIACFGKLQEIKERL